MKTLLALLLLIPLSLQAELLEFEDENIKCLGQDLLGTEELNGFAHCINKQSNWNYYYDIDDDGLIKDDIIIQIPEDKSFIIFSEYKDGTNNGVQFGIRKNSNIWLNEFLDGKKHGLETTHNYELELTRIREYWEDKISETTPIEIKQINNTHIQITNTKRSTSSISHTKQLYYLNKTTLLYTHKNHLSFLQNNYLK